MRIEFHSGWKVVVFSSDDAHKQWMKAQLQFTTVAEKFNQGEYRKPGCILVFGVFFVSFWTTCPDERSIFGSKKNKKEIHAL
jgi:hypothetical protein